MAPEAVAQSDRKENLLGMVVGTTDWSMLHICLPGEQKLWEFLGKGQPPSPYTHRRLLDKETFLIPVIHQKAVLQLKSAFRSERSSASLLLR